MTVISFSLTLSTAGSTRLSAATVASIAELCGYDGIDAELSPRRRIVARNHARDVALPAVRTIWLTHRFADDIARICDALGHFGQTARHPLIIVRTGIESDTASFRKSIQTARQLRARLGDSHQIAVGIEPRLAGPTGKYLDALIVLRLQASEWDLGVALDLAGQVDWHWEAEAAVSRLMPSLQVIRVRLPNRAFDGQFREAIAVRSLMTAFECSYRGQIAVVPSLPLWYARNTNALQSVAADAKRMLSLSGPGAMPYGPAHLRPRPPVREDSKKR